MVKVVSNRRESEFPPTEEEETGDPEFKGWETQPLRTIMASVEILTIPIGSQLTSTIRSGEPEDKNDFPVLFLFSENVTGLTEAGITLSAGASLVALEGDGVTWQATIRPPVTSGIVTVTVVANAVNEGNAETSKDIRVTKFFPDVDAQAPTLLFNHGLSYSFYQRSGTSGRGIACSPSRIIISSGGARGGSAERNYIDFFTYDGIRQTSETITSDASNQNRVAAIDFINGDLLYQHSRAQAYGWGRLNLETLEYQRASGGAHNIAHTRLGVAVATTDSVIIQPYDFDADTITHDIDFPGGARIDGAAHQSDLLYVYSGRSSYSDSFPGSRWNIAAITDEDAIELIASLNIAQVSSSGSAFRDIAIFGDTLYLLSSNTTPGGSSATPGIYTIDIRPYRPTALNTKTTIYPQFVEAGERLDLTQFSPDAERFTFDVGFDKPSYLSINSSNELAVGSGAETIFVKLKAINRIDATETDSFGFYLIIRQAQAPVWRNVSELTMRAGSSYDLFQLVESGLETPPTIAFRSGRARLTDSSLANGIFTIGTVGGTAAFTARKGNRSSHIAINIDVVQRFGDTIPSQRSDVFRYKVEIAGIDVTSDLVGSPSVSETLDPVIINEYRVNDAAITLRNEGGKYNSNLAGNFWETHGLNAGGFQNAVKIYTEHFDGRGDLAPTENLLFTGLILESFEPISDATFKMSCVDISSRLRKALAQDFGTLEKWDSLRKLSDEDSFEGTYIPERSLLPMQIGTGMARSDRTDLHISRLELPSEGPSEQNTAYMTPMELKTAGGFLDANPLLRFKTDHRSEDVRFLINQLATNKEVYNTEIDIPGVTLADPFLLNRGSVAFSVERTRTTRLPVDWVVGVESGLQTPPTILILLSNPERHIADLLVQYDINSDSYRVLHTFDKGTAVHRIERRNATNYYILTSAKITQDRSARQLPRSNDSVRYAYDSLAEGNEIKIYHYNSGSQTAPTVFVDSDDDYPPQLGIQYPVGFENGLNIDEFEGIRPDYRGAFRWYSNNLYYRYAKDGEFGVARVNTSGTTTKMIGQAVGKYQNHLNFAFDRTSTGTIYFVYAIGDANGSTLVIKRRTSSGTESTILTDIRGLAAFSDIHSEFGAYLGAHEVLFYNNHLYILAPMQMADFGEDATNTQADPDFIIERADTGMTGERSVTTSTNLNPTSRRLAPGDDIPIRIDFDGSISGATQSDLTVYDGTIQSFSISSDMIDVTIRPDDPTRHRNIVIDLAENAVTQRNEATRIIVDFGTRRSRTKTGGMVLYKCNVSAGSPSLTAVDTWDFVHQAGCNLTVHDGAVYFVEAPSAASRFKPYNPDLDTYNEEMGYNVLPEALGALKKINSSGEVESLGNVWHTDRPYNVFPTRMLSIEDALHLCAGYGNGDEVLRFNSLASQADNMVHIVRGRTLHYVLPTFQPNGRSIYAALAGLAKSVNATLSFEKNVIMITDRRPFRAVTDGGTGTGTADIDFSDANKTFPSSGYLQIGEELLKYSGISSSAFTGVTRGVLGSAISDHADNSEILYLDNLIQTEGLGSPYKKITLQSDVNRIFNIIRDSAGIVEVRDEASINLYGERPYTLDLGLTRHEKAWIEEIFKSYLEELKDPKSIVNIQVIPDFSLRIGQIIPFFYAGQVKAMRIVSIRYERNATHVKGRTV